MGVAERCADKAPGECEIMKKRSLLIFLSWWPAWPLRRYATRSSWMDAASGKAQPGTARARTHVAVRSRTRQRKPVPVEVEAIGTVSPIASVALKSRIETTITEVHFEDGAHVKQGDMLFTLDGRQIDAQIAQAEGTLARDHAQLAGAERECKRYSELIAKGATTQLNVDNAQTQADALRGTVQIQRVATGEPEGPEELHGHPRADLGPDQRRQRQGRQLRPPGRRRAARDDQPDRADLRRVRRSAARAAGSARRHEGRRAPASSRRCRATRRARPARWR